MHTARVRGLLRYFGPRSRVHRGRQDLLQKYRRGLTKQLGEQVKRALAERHRLSAEAHQRKY